MNPLPKNEIERPTPTALWKRANQHFKNPPKIKIIEWKFDDTLVEDISPLALPSPPALENQTKVQPNPTSILECPKQLDDSWGMSFPNKQKWFDQKKDFEPFLDDRGGVIFDEPEHIDGYESISDNEDQGESSSNNTCYNKLLLQDYMIRQIYHMDRQDSKVGNNDDLRWQTFFH